MTHQFHPSSLFATRCRATVVAYALTWCTLFLTSRLSGESIEPLEAFTYPFRTINVSSVEVGILTSIDVEEGDVVARNDLLGTLDHEVLDASLAVAEQEMQSRARVESAEAELKLASMRLAKLEELARHGHARPDEIDRARTNLEVAQAQTLAAEESLATKRLEYARIQAMIARRFIRSPVDGVVTKRLKQLGEHVAPTSPEVVTIVQLDPLLVAFTVPLGQAAKLKSDEVATIQFAGSEKTVAARIHSISPLIDAESGTVRVEVRIDNPHRQFRAGQSCTLHLSEPAQDAK